MTSVVEWIAKYQRCTVEGACSEIEVVSLSLPNVLLLPSIDLVSGLLPSPGKMLGHVKGAVFVSGG